MVSINHHLFSKETIPMLFRKNYNSIIFLISTSLASAQTQDSITNTLDEVIVTSFQKTTPYLENTSSVATINQQILNTNNPERLVDAVNLISGTKMEERSPGSYRLSLRGSTIRSPFGVRNVKIYWDDFILTDATGNSYLNNIEPDFINSIEIRKGPQGGEIGAETGGVIILKSSLKDQINLNLSAGSYNQFSEKINISKTLGKHHLTIGQSHYQSKSYRAQSAINRTSFYINDNWNYNAKNTLKIKAFYTDLDYETPGGLTQAQMHENRQQARLATATLPSATTQKTAIYNQTFLGGIAHIWNINKNWAQFSLIQTSFTDLENPFISNYEVRDEKNFQTRWYVDYKKEFKNSSTRTRIGLETGYNKTDFKNYDNLEGNIGNPQKFDLLSTQTYFYYFTQHFEFNKKLFIDASLSLKNTKYQWNTLFPNSENGEQKFQNQLLPNFAVTYKINETLSLRGKIAKGNSAPTTEEIRSSNQQISQNLMPEYGWNRELGIRKRIGSLFFETTFFHYELKDAIVKRQNEEGNDFFINSGGTKQLGIEFTIESKNFNFKNNFVNQLQFLVSGNIYDFKYNNYQIEDNNFTGNRLPGISNFSVQALINLKILDLLQINFTNFYNSSMYLNDGNTVKEKDHLIGNLKFNLPFQLSKVKSNAFLGINNIYNTKYSSGYDLNAFGNRFYNPAALRNYYLGLKFNL